MGCLKLSYLDFDKYRFDGRLFEALFSHTVGQEVSLTI